MSPPRSTAERVDPATLGPAARDQLVEALYEVHRRIFDGVSRDDFARYVVLSPAQRTRIEIYRDGDRVVGYAAVHVFERRVDGRECAVFRCEVGLLPEHRGATRFGWMFVREALAQLLRRPGVPIFGLSCATSPATYCSLVRHAAELWPRPDRETPPSLDALMRSLAEDFGLRPIEGRPGVYAVGWQTRQSPRELQRWRATRHPAARFYVDRNPEHHLGHGLLLLVPMSPALFCRGVARFLASRARRRLAPRRRLPHAPIPSENRP